MALWERIFTCVGMVVCTFERVYPVDRSARDETALQTTNVCAYALIALLCKVIILTQLKLLVFTSVCYSVVRRPHEERGKALRIKG